MFNVLYSTCHGGRADEQHLVEDAKHEEEPPDVQHRKHAQQHGACHGEGSAGMKADGQTSSHESVRISTKKMGEKVMQNMSVFVARSRTYIS